MWLNRDLKALEDLMAIAAGSGCRFSIILDDSIHPYGLDHRHSDELKQVRANARKFGIIVLSSNSATFKLDKQHAWKQVARYTRSEGGKQDKPYRQWVRDPQRFLDDQKGANRQI